MPRLLTLFAFLLCGPALLPAQEFRATVTGRVTDPSGAAVVGAAIRAINVETQATTATRSNESGAYVLPALSPGNYRLEVEQQGFKRHVREGIVLQVQDRPTLDIVLEVGDLNTSVSVSAEAPLLETSTASRGTVISGRTLVDLPLNGRNVFALAALEPGVTLTVRGQASTFLRTTANAGISGLAISGGQPRANEALLDGVPNTGSDGLIQFVPSVDATQEFRVQTNSFDAEFGRFTGGLINAAIRSGTNDLHGTLFHFLRNSAVNARDPFATTIPQFGYNLFGGSVGGPVWLPKLYNGRNRTFWFFNYEGSREGVPRAFVSTVPTALQRQGDFSQTRLRVGSQALPVTIFDPATTRQQGTTFVRDPFPGNVIPADRLDPVARRLLSLYPLPNAPGDADTGANNYLLSFKDPVKDDGYVIKVDHRFSDRHAVFARYSFRRFFVGRAGAFRNEVTGDSETRDAPGFAFDDTFTINPTTVLNIRYGLARFYTTAAADSLGADLTALGFSPAYAGQVVTAAIPTIGISNGLTTISAPGKLTRSAEDAHTLRGSVMKVAGPHSVRVGAEFRLLRSNSGALGAAAAGSFNFDQVFTRGPNPQQNVANAGFGLASFLLGLPASGSLANNVATADQVPYYGLYVQDDWRVSRRLTINAGVRYEWEGAYTERYNRLNRGFDAAAESPLATRARAVYAANPIAELPVDRFQVRGGLLFAGVGGQPRGLADIDRNNIAPRVGVAYQLAPRTVLRGGYGLFYGAATLAGESRLGFSVTTPFVGTIDAGLTPFNRLSNPFPEGTLQPSGAAEGLLTLAGQGIGFTAVNRRQPLAHQYQFSVQHELPGNILVDAAYVGNTGRDLAVNQPLNAIPETFRAQAETTLVQTGRNVLNDSVPNPFFGLITTGTLSGRTITRGQLLRPFPQFTGITANTAPLGSSRFDAFQMKVTKRLSAGLSLSAAYAKSKQLERTRFLNDQDERPVRELAEFDIPQRLVLSTTYELPFGPGRALLAGARGPLARVVEGWQLNVIYTAQGGVPLTMENAESLGRSAQLDASEQTVTRWFDTDAFRLRQPLELTRTSRLPDVRSAGKNNFDFSVFKNTTLTERIRLQFRAEAFNALNRPEWSSPNTTFGNANFGRVTSTNTFARQIQFGLKLLW